MRKKAAVIGVTGFGLHHFVNLVKLADEKLLDLAAAVVRTPAKAAEQLETMRARGTRIYASADELFSAEAGKLDLVCIPVGIDAHETLTASALEAGMNVLLEKPAAGSTEAVRRMIDAEKASGKFAAVAFQHCYAPEIQFLKRLLLSGRLGAVVRSGVMVCWPRDDAYYHRNSWAAKREVRGVPVLDSPLNNACAHYLNLLLFLNGPAQYRCAMPRSVAGKVMRARPEIEMFDACDVDFALDNGASARVLLAHCCSEKIDPEIRIVCENGIIVWRNNRDWSVTAADGARIASGQAVHPGEAMFRLIVKKLDFPETPAYTLENALAHTVGVEMLDRMLPIEAADAEYRDGIFRGPGLERRFTEKFAEVSK